MGTMEPRVFQEVMDKRDRKGNVGHKVRGDSQDRKENVGYKV